MNRERTGITMKKKWTMLSVLAALVVAAGALTAFAASPKQEPVPGLSQEQAAETVETAETEDPVAGQSGQEVEQFLVGYWTEPQDLYVDDYLSFGLSFDGQGRLLYQGELVRFFIDGATEQPHDGSYTIDDVRYTNVQCVSLYEYCNEEGTIDLYSIREIDQTATDGCRGLGEMTGIGVYDPATFDQRSFVYWTDLEN